MGHRMTQWIVFSIHRAGISLSENPGGAENLLFISIAKLSDIYLSSALNQRSRLISNGDSSSKKKINQRIIPWLQHREHQLSLSKYIEPIHNFLFLLMRLDPKATKLFSFTFTNYIKNYTKITIGAKSIMAFRIKCFREREKIFGFSNHF